MVNLIIFRWISYINVLLWTLCHVSLKYSTTRKIGSKKHCQVLTIYIHTQNPILINIYIYIYIPNQRRVKQYYSVLNIIRAIHASILPFLSRLVSYRFSLSPLEVSLFYEPHIHALYVAFSLLFRCVSFYNSIIIHNCTNSTYYVNHLHIHVALYVSSSRFSSLLQLAYTRTLYVTL